MTKSSFPYLVDVKITEKCPFGCTFCYTSSTQQGEDAVYYQLEKMLHHLAEAGVLEIAIGGGEPTLHPALNEFLQKAKDLRFGVSLTTKNYNPDIRDIDLCDSVAFSVFNKEEVDKVNTLRYLTSTKIYLQTIIGVMPFDDTLKLLKYMRDKKCSLLTLLGYKSFGFGLNTSYYNPPADWIEQVKAIYPFFGVDSILIKQYKSKFKELGVKDIFMVGREGGQTCYVDAVRQTVAPSSFTNQNIIKLDKLFGPYDDAPKLFLEAFRSF